MRTTSTSYEQATAVRLAVTALDARARAERRGDLPLAQISVLGRIVRLGPITPGELGRQLAMLPQSLTRPLAKLERAGLIHRTADPEDGRGALLTATQAGLRAMHVEFAPRTRWLAEAMDAVCDEAERETLLRAAEIMQRMAEYGADVAPREV